jgi:hypothetical protein
MTLFGAILLFLLVLLVAWAAIAWMTGRDWFWWFVYKTTMKQESAWIPFMENFRDQIMTRHRGYDPKSVALNDCNLSMYQWLAQYGGRKPICAVSCQIDLTQKNHATGRRPDQSADRPPEP